MFSHKQKGICTVISAICIHITLGNIYTWSNINHYLVSYSHIDNKNITLVDGYFIVPNAILADTCFIFISGFLENSLGTRILSLIGVLGGIKCHLLIYFSKNFIIINIAFIIYGIGIGLSYFPILKTSWKYFPEKKALITGIILCVFGLCPMVFTSIADFVINPKKDKPDDKGIYKESIAIKMKNYALIKVIVFTICGLLSQLLMFPLDNIESTDKEDLKDKVIKKEDNRQYEKLNLPNSENIDITPNENIEITPNENIEITPNENIEINQPFKQAALSIRFHLFNIMSLGNLVFGFFSQNTTRSFGSLRGIDEDKLQLMSKICGLLNGIFRLTWGVIYEWLGFRIPYTIICCIQIFCSATFYFAGKNFYLYLIDNIIENIGFSGHGTIAPPLIATIFGIKNSVKLIGITGYYLGAAGYVLPIIGKFKIKKLEDFLIVYLIGTGFSIVALIICVTLSVEKFVYNQEVKIQSDTGKIENDEITKEEEINQKKYENNHISDADSLI